MGYFDNHTFSNQDAYDFYKTNIKKSKNYYDNINNKRNKTEDNSYDKTELNKQQKKYVNINSNKNDFNYSINR